MLASGRHPDDAARLLHRLHLIMGCPGGADDADRGVDAGKKAIPAEPPPSASRLATIS